MKIAEAKKQLKKKVNFKKLSKSKQRVLLAKDVIAELKLRKVRPAHCYADVSFKKVFSKKELADPQLLIRTVQVSEQPRKACYVCALGAMFIADVDRKNKLEVDVPNREMGYTGITNGYDFGRSELVVRLRKIFSEDQLGLIESAYEEAPMTRCDLPHMEDAVAFGESIPDDQDRMIAIMENIIENKGRFAPPDAETLAASSENSDDDEGGSMESASEDGVCADEGDVFSL